MIFRLFCSVALTGALALSASTAARAFDHAAVAKQALERHIVPGYQNFAGKTKALADKTTALCSGAKGASLADVRSAFTDAVTAWGRIAHVRFGPVATENRFEKILFWPDPRHVTSKQVSNILRKLPADALKPDYAASASVAVVGLRSLEITLFGRGADKLEAHEGEDSSFRCGFAQALAGSLNRTAAEVLAEWSDGGSYRKLWLTAGPGNPRYLKPSETTQALVQSFGERFGRMLAQDIPEQAGQGQPLFALSGAATAYLAAGTEGLEELLMAGGFADQAAADATGDIRERLETIATELRFARRGLELIERSAGAEGFKSITTAAWQAVRLPLKNAHELGDETLKVQAGLSSGFNSLDGD